MPQTVVIGAGISAAAYLASIQNDRELQRKVGEVGVLGGPDLWQRLDPEHSMGQPAHLLKGGLLHGLMNRPGEAFLRAGEFSTVVQYCLAKYSNVRMPDTWVRHVSRPSGLHGKYRVTYQRGASEDLDTVDVDNVIIALGPGSPRPLQTQGQNGKLTDVNVGQFNGHIVGGTEFMSPDWEMPHGQMEGSNVVVYGGSATAAWAVELALMRRMNVVCWFTRPGDKGPAWDVAERFRDAFPPGSRNTGVEKSTRDVRKVLRLTEINPSEHGTVQLFCEEESHGVWGYVVDVLVYALGSAHTATAGVRTRIHPDLQRDFVAFYDRDQVLSAKPSLLAVGTPDGSLLIVGSAMTSAAGFGGSELFLKGDPRKTMDSLQPYSKIADTLPAAARPTEGIAMVMASIEALNQFMPATPKIGAADPLYGNQFNWNINPSTSNRTQLAAYLASETDLSPFAASLAVALIIKLRTRPGNPLGLSPEQAWIVVKTAERYAERMKQIDPQLYHDPTLYPSQNEYKRRQAERPTGFMDGYLDLCTTWLTRTWMMATFWSRFDIR